MKMRRPLPADQEGREDHDDGSNAENDSEPYRHGAMMADSAPVRKLTTTEP
jgi:hypothetical protein